jgi:polyisoprenoid-binding protein YceI
MAAPDAGAPEWRIDDARSSITFSVRHLLLTRTRGRVLRWHGRLRMDPSTMTTAAVEVEMDAASFDTGNGERDQALRAPGGLDVARYPTVRFISRSVEPAGARRFRVRGELTVRDEARPVVLDVTHTGSGREPDGTERASFTARATVDRRDYHIRWNALLETGGVLVGDQVEIEIAVTALRR